MTMWYKWEKILRAVRKNIFKKNESETFGNDRLTFRETMSLKHPLLKQYTWHKQKEETFILAYGFNPWLSVPVGLWWGSEEQSH